MNGSSEDVRNGGCGVAGGRSNVPPKPPISLGDAGDSGDKGDNCGNGDGGKYEVGYDALDFLALQRWEGEGGAVAPVN